MILKSTNGRNIEVSELDKDNEICFEIDGLDEFEKNIILWITIEETKKLIEFLKKQGEIFKN